MYRENTFTSATIEVAQDQHVVSTGPYVVVRHPMYASAPVYLLGTPLGLGSYWGFVPFAGILPFLIWRLFDDFFSVTTGYGLSPAASHCT